MSRNNSRFDPLVFTSGAYNANEKNKNGCKSQNSNLQVIQSLEEKTEQPSTHVRVNLIFYYMIIYFLKDHLVVVNNNKKGSINIQTQRPNVYFQTMIDSKL